MPDLVRIPIGRADQERLGYAAHQAGKPPLEFLRDLIHDLAQAYPMPPMRPARRSLSEVREQSRLRNGGVSAYTAAIDVIPPRSTDGT